MSSGVEGNEAEELVDEKSLRRPCRICAEPIRFTARKCIHCSSFQDWRRHFGFSSTVLSLLIALFAVLGQSIAAIRDAFHEKRSEIRFAVQSTSPQRIATLVSNDGDRSGTVSQGMLTLPDGRRIALTLLSEGGVVLVPPHSSALLNYFIQGDPGRPPNMNSICKFALLIADENGIRSFDDQNLRCANFAGAFYGWRFGDDGEPVRIPPTE